MKKIKYYLLPIIALIIYLLLPKADNTKPVQVNTSINPNKVVAQNLNKAKVKSVKKEQTISGVDELQSVQEEKQKTKEPKISYLQAYREYTFFQQCSWVIRGAQKSEDLQAAFKHKIANSFSGLQQIKHEPTEKQYVAFELFKNKCFDLMISSNDSYNENQQQLKKKYQQMQPSTAEEINLYDGLKLLQKYEVSNKQINTAKRGVSTLNDSMKLPIKKQIHNLNKEMYRVGVMDDRYSSETRQLQYENLQKKVNELNLQLESYKVYDSELIKRLEAEHINVMQEMVSLLVNNESPDILLLFGRILMHPYVVEKKFNTDIFTSIKVYDRVLALSIYDAGIMLAACALNYPCDTGSSSMFRYCFNGYVIYKEACGKSVEDFIFTYVLGPNQLQDVENFITHVLKYYAKN